MQESTFYTVTGAFFLGVVWRSLAFVPLAVMLFILLVASILLGAYFYLKERLYLLGFLACFCLVIGVLRVDIAEPAVIPDLDTRLDQEVVIEGVVVDEVVRSAGSAKVTLSIEKIEGEYLDTEKRLRIFADHYQDITYGDHIEVVGELVKPENFQTETGREFNYVGYLQADRVYYQMFYPDITALEEGQGNWLVARLLGLKSLFLENIRQVMPEPEASLMGGITVGAETGLGEDLEEDFRQTGIIHIVVLSGYNVTIVAESIMRLLGFIPLMARLLFGAGAIILFALLVGGGATVVRASLMALLVLLARATGRSYAITRALFLAALLMVLHNPFILTFDPSFQLSFLASLGLIALAPLVEQRLQVVPEGLQLREFATATIATQIFVLPLLLWMTGELSIVAVPTNLLVLPVIPSSMFIGLLVALLVLLSPLLALPVAFLGTLLLGYVLKVVDILAAVPGATLTLPQIPFWLVIAIYVLMGGALWWWHRHRKTSDSKQEKRPSTA